MQRIKNSQLLHQLGDTRFHSLPDAIRDLEKQSTQTMPADLLGVIQVKILECFFNRLMRSKMGPLMVTVGRAQPLLIKILATLMQPVRGTVGHRPSPD